MKTAHPLLRCLAIYREMPGRFALTALLFTVVNLSLAWQQWLVGRAVHDVERGVAVVALPDGGFDAGVAWFWLLILVGVAGTRGVLQYIAGMLSLLIGQHLLTLIRDRILAQVQRLDLAYHWRHGVGELVTRTTRDADKVRDALVSFWRQVFETALVVIAAVGLLAWYDWRLAAVPLLLTVIGMAIFIRQTDRLVALDRAVGAAYDRVNQDLSEGINGVRVIKAFALEPRRIDGFERQVGVFVEQARAALAYSASRIPLPQVVVALGHVWILGCGAQLVAAGQLNLGELVASLLIATTLVFRIEGVGRVMQVFADARASAARIWELLDAEPAIADGAEALPPGPLGVRCFDVGVDSPGVATSGVATSGVATPGGGNRILDRCAFTIAPGEVVALVGATGAGKSTLASLLPRLLDAGTGAVMVGSETSGWRDVRRLRLAALRGAVHVVPQESFLFSDTLAANLRLAAPDATEMELREALHLAAVEEVLARLPAGLETRLGDRGATLSGGQRQRVCLARALLAQPSILVLDDATSALDALTEQRVLANIRALRRRSGRATTVLMVAGKLSTVLLADRVLLLADGRIAAQGSHEQLARENAAYRDLLGLD